MRPKTSEPVNAGPDCPMEFRWLPVRDIRSSDAAPRRLEHPAWNIMRESIRHRGMEAPLVVAKIDGEKVYELQTGGLTRLRALVSLFEETKDSRFSLAPCLVVERRGEMDQIIGHLIAEHARSDLTFLERARAVALLWRDFLKELPSHEVPKRSFLAILKAQGLLLSRPTLTHMLYAIDRLLPCMPQLLETRMDLSCVSKVRSLEAAGRRVWHTWCAEQVPFEPAFEALCTRLDGPNWDFASLRKAVELELATEAEVSLELARLRIEEELSSWQAGAKSRNQSAELSEGWLAGPTALRGVRNQGKQVPDLPIHSRDVCRPDMSCVSALEDSPLPRTPA